MPRNEQAKKWSLETTKEGRKVPERKNEGSAQMPMARNGTTNEGVQWQRLGRVQTDCQKHQRRGNHERKTFRENLEQYAEDGGAKFRRS